MNNDDDDDKKRKVNNSSTSANEDERPNKKQRIVELPGINIPDTPNLLEVLRDFGSNLALVSRESRIPSEQVSTNFNRLQQQINQALEDAFREAQIIAAQSEEAQRQEENAAMTEAENDHRRQIEQRFLQRLQPLFQDIREQLTIGQQVQLFDETINTFNSIINNVRNRENDSNPGHISTIIALAIVTNNFVLELLTVIISNIYQSTPQITTQLIAIISASGMIYNYLPENIRGQFARLPYIGSIFTIMNYVNPVTIRVQNSTAVVTSIYYLLRNAGIDADRSLATIGSTAQELARQIRSLVASSVGSITNSATSLMNTLATRLRELLTQTYNISNSYSSDSSQMSQSSLDSLQTSISSKRSVNVSETQISNNTEVSVQNVIALLNTPVSEGGIDIDPNNIPNEIVEERLLALASLASEDAQSNPLIPEDTEVSESVSSDITGSDSQEHWSVWLYGRPSNNESNDESNDEKANLGGKKTRRYKKAKKHFTKKHRITKRQKKYLKKRGKGKGSKKRAFKKHSKRNK
jgi:hypothetical protein